MNFEALKITLTKEEIAEITKRLDTNKKLIKALPNLGTDDVFA